MSDPTKIHVHTSTDGPCGYCSGDDCPMRYCPGCPPGCPLAEDEPDEDHDHHSDVRSVSPARDAVTDAEAARWGALADAVTEGSWTASGRTVLGDGYGAEYVSIPTVRWTRDRAHPAVPRLLADRERLTGEASRVPVLLADKAALMGDVDRLTAERDRARGLAATLEAENARLRECVERMASEMQRGRLIPGTPVFGCAACGIPTESEPCRDHDEGLQHAGDMLRALLADAVVGGTSWSVRGISWYEPLKRDTLVPHDHTQRVPGCFRCDLSSLEVPNA